MVRETAPCKGARKKPIMLDVKFLRNNMDFVRRKMEERGAPVALDRFTGLDAKRRDLLEELENLRNERNLVSRAVGEKKKSKEDFSSLLSGMSGVSARIRELEESLKNTEEELNSVLLAIPNIPHESVLSGACSEDNPVVRHWGEKPAFNFTPRPHWEIGESLGILDFVRGAKITGARFTLYRGMGAMLERPLINFMVDLHTSERHYTEIMPPFLVNRESLTGTGQLPKFAEDLFKIEDMDYFLIPTAEVPVTNIHRDEILEERELPLYYAAWSACFRAEAGSYGKDTRGLIRQHQFNKVELVKFTRPETSYDELEKLTADAEEILKRLNIHFRTVSLCTGDLGFSSAKTYDIEAWLPGQDAYREISSCSNFEAFQPPRASIRFRRGETGKLEFVHTINGSGLAVGRTLAAILRSEEHTSEL